MANPSCGCEPTWPTGIDKTGCWWHSGAGVHENPVRPSTDDTKTDFGMISVRGTA